MGACVNPDCLFPHAFQWQNGVRTDLGALPGGVASFSNWISDSGLIVGSSQNGVIDPLTGSAETRAVLWHNGHIRNLGTLGGNQSFAAAANSAGQVVGPAANQIPDMFHFPFGWATETRAFLWQNGKMKDLGTLGGPDAGAFYINERGQIAGASFTNSMPNPITGIPTNAPFLWQDGHMLDLGTLGGTLGFPNGMNNLGHVAGNSNLAGDMSFHPFLWNGEKMIDLGTFGGTFGNANAINDSDWVVGDANFRGDIIHRAALWRPGEEIRELGVISSDKCSTAWAINSKGQIVGASGDCGIAVHAFLWENGHMIDLTRLIRPGIELTYGFTINDAGEIAAIGRVPGGGDTGLQHAFLLIPRDK